MTTGPPPLAPARIPADALFGVARRLDAGRLFLLVSRVLGKHIPVEPAIPLAAGAALALQLAPDGDLRRAGVALALADRQAAHALWADLRRRPLEGLGRVAVVGFAETATGLGHAVAECIAGARYHQTTRRRQAAGPPPVAVDERHSHARDQWLYAVPEACDLLIVVDDELTTGVTAQALMAAVQPVARASAFAFLALCDSISPERRAALDAAAVALGTRVRVASLHAIDAAPQEPDVAGSRARRPAGVPSAAQEVVRLTPTGPVTGRRTAADAAAVEELVHTAAAEVRARLTGGRLHVLGTGEFMHLPVRIAAELGEGVTISSTTRSPIVVCDRRDYPVRSGVAFAATDGGERTEYAYNLRPGDFEHLAVIAEDPPELLTPLIDALGAAGLPRPLVLVVDGADG